jgi:hypothetical protein
MKVSSTNLNQHFGLRGKLSRDIYSKCSMKMFSTLGNRDEPIVVPLFCS